MVPCLCLFTQLGHLQKEPCRVLRGFSSRLIHSTSRLLLRRCRTCSVAAARGTSFQRLYYFPPWPISSLSFASPSRVSRPLTPYLTGSRAFPPTAFPLSALPSSHSRSRSRRPIFLALFSWPCLLALSSRPWLLGLALGTRSVAHFFFLDERLDPFTAAVTVPGTVRPSPNPRIAVPCCPYRARRHTVLRPPRTPANASAKTLPPSLTALSTRCAALCTALTDQTAHRFPHTSRVPLCSGLARSLSPSRPGREIRLRFPRHPAPQSSTTSPSPPTPQPRRHPALSLVSAGAALTSRPLMA